MDQAINREIVLGATPSREERASRTSLGAAGVVVQVLLLYLVTRELLVTTFILHYFAPMTGTVHFRTAVAVLLACVAVSARGLGPNFSAFGPWGWVVLGSFAVLLFVEGVVTITSGGIHKRMVIVFIDTTIVLFALSVAYLFAARRLQRRAVLRFLLQPYCYFVIFVAAAGLTAWILVHFAIVNPQDWLLPEGLLKKDKESSVGYLYAMPFFTSLVLSARGAIFLGFDFSRASGLFQEPHIVALFVSPALFFLPLVFNSRSQRWKLRSSYLLLLAFLFVVHSVTNLMLLTVIGALLLGRLALTHRTARGRLVALTLLLVLVVISWLAISSPGTIRSKVSQSSGSYVEVIQNTLERAPAFGPGVFARGLEPGFYPDAQSQGLISFFALGIHVGLLVVLGLGMLISKSPRWYVGGAMIYLAGHTVKSVGLVVTSGLYLYMLFIIALALACYWNAENRRSRVPPPASEVG